MRTTGYQGTTRGANLTQCAANYTRYLRRALPENPESYYKLELGAWILALSLRVDVAVVTFFLSKRPVHKCQGSQWTKFEVRYRFRRSQGKHTGCSS